MSGHSKWASIKHKKGALDKKRGKLTGFFMGKVMQASKGQADGRAATALLRSRAGL